MGLHAAPDSSTLAAAVACRHQPAPWVPCASQSTKKRAHAFALQREQAEQERLKAKQAKKEAKVERVVQEGAVAKRKAKPKAIRLRKGVVVKV